MKIIWFSFKVPGSLVWKKEGLRYGNWEQGPNADSIFEFSTQLPLSERVSNNSLILLYKMFYSGSKQWINLHAYFCCPRGEVS